MDRERKERLHLTLDKDIAERLKLEAKVREVALGALIERILDREFLRLGEHDNKALGRYLEGRNHEETGTRGP